MPLVDYSSSDSSSGSKSGPDEASPRKRRRIADGSPILPRLPPAFHDLYASTVRTATSDDPSLHQGRTRQIPHVVGHWPSHIYIEWHPDSATHSLLDSLLSRLRDKLPSSVQLTSFLTSDLGAPLPLHISLSRPVSLTTGNKDAFLARLESSIAGCATGPFDLAACGVEWHRTDESGRSFLVIRVRSNGTTAGNTDSCYSYNPELTALLRRCNSIVADHGQPQLYHSAVEGNGNGKGGSAADGRVGRAFHISIAWSFEEPTEDMKRLTEEVFGGETTSAQIRRSRISVDGIKAKIGNVVTHIELPQRGRLGGKGTQNMLGL